MLKKTKKQKILHKTILCLFTGFLSVHVKAQKKVWKGVYQTDKSGYSQGTGGVAGRIFMHYL